MKVVSFFGTVAANSEKVLVSPRIATPYVVKEISARFAQGCNNLVINKFYIASDNHAPASGEPSGTSLLADYGQVDYVSGNDDTKRMRHEVAVGQGGTYLKVYAENSDSFEHSIDVQIEILTKTR